MNKYEQIYNIVKKIPKGKVTTYGAIAKVIGLKSSARFVGWAMNAAKGRDDVPAHRVVNRNGELTGKMHFPTPHIMREMLETEGVTFNKNDAVILEKHFWDPAEKQ